ncbi:hypothetical protein [Bradyrhizobium sp.]|uniref:hypothetical protein n=1 Tax=Bradyrhizobium sp. TaxID=376 RepID=UPI003C4AE36F
MPNAIFRLITFTLCLGLFLGLATTITPRAARAQAGSAGGSVGNDDKSLSGSRPDSPEGRSVESDQPAHHSKPQAEGPRRASRSNGGSGGNFDGTWTFVGTSTNCRGSGSVSGVISGGRVVGPGTIGSVSPNGAYHGVSVGNDGIRLTASGRLSGKSGSGTYARSDGCVGRWIAAKQ